MFNVHRYIQPVCQRKLSDALSFPPQCDLLLLEISPLFLVHQHQVQIVPERGEAFSMDFQFSNVGFPLQKDERINFEGMNNT